MTLSISLFSIVASKYFPHKIKIIGEGFLLDFKCLLLISSLAKEAALGIYTTVFSKYGEHNLDSVAPCSM